MGPIFLDDNLPIIQKLQKKMNENVLIQRVFVRERERVDGGMILVIISMSLNNSDISSDLFYIYIFNWSGRTLR